MNPAPKKHTKTHKHTPSTVKKNRRDDFIASIARSYGNCLSLVEKKNSDYARGDDPFQNFKNSLSVGVPVDRGILTRIMDKITRISNLLEKDPSVAGESIEDSIDDACNYLQILKEYHRETKKNHPSTQEKEFQKFFNDDNATNSDLNLDN